MKKITATSLAIAIVSSILLSSSATYAETIQNSQALEIAPPVLTLSADPGQTIKAKINLRDISNGNLVVTNEINNFTAAGEDGTPKIILDGSDDNDPYTLKNWISPLDKITLEPKQIKEVIVTIKVPADAAPGGYYGIIRFSGNPPELEGTGVSLSASLGSLIFLRVNGTVKESVSIPSFSTESDGRETSLFEFSPIGFSVKVENTGNIYEQPVGQITITDMFNKKIANVNVNLDGKYVLSGTTRKFVEKLDKSNIGKKILFGKYRADLTMKYGNDKEYVITKSITFWVIPYKLIAVCIAITILIFFIFRYSIKQYNRSVIRYAQGSHKRKTRR